MPRTKAQKEWDKRNTTRIVLEIRNHIATNLRDYCKSQGIPVTTYLLGLARADMVAHGVDLDCKETTGNIDKLD